MGEARDDRRDREGGLGVKVDGFKGGEVMEYQDIIQFWGENNLFRWTEDDVKDSAIPDSAKRFLVTVGLRCSETWSMRFDLTTSRLPRVPHIMRLRQIGWDCDLVPICIDETNGFVVSSESDDGEDLRFINPTVELFGENLIYYHEYREEVLINETDDNNIIYLFEEKLKKSDSLSFSNDNNWWPVVIEQIRHGLL
jgi:hypothetical protein